jgi:hypothetical protein
LKASTCFRRSMDTDACTPSPSLPRTSASCSSWFILMGSVRLGLPHPKSATSYALKAGDPDTFINRSGRTAGSPASLKNSHPGQQPSGSSTISYTARCTADPTACPGGATVDPEEIRGPARRRRRWEQGTGGGARERDAVSRSYRRR